MNDTTKSNKSDQVLNCVHRIGLKKFSKQIAHTNTNADFIQLYSLHFHVNSMCNSLISSHIVMCCASAEWLWQFSAFTCAQPSTSVQTSAAHRGRDTHKSLSFFPEIGENVPYHRFNGIANRLKTIMKRRWRGKLRRPELIKRFSSANWRSFRTVTRHSTR